MCSSCLKLASDVEGAVETDWAGAGDISILEQSYVGASRKGLLK